MSRLLFILFITFITAPSFAQHYRLAKGQDVLSYEFAISIENASKAITGRAVIKIAVDKRKSVLLDLASVDSDSSGMVVQAVSINGKATGFTHQDDKLSIDLPELISDTITIAISYQGVPKDGLIISESKFGNTVFFGDNYPDRARLWLPCVDHPADKASVSWKITAPMEYGVVASGTLVKELTLAGGKRLWLYVEDRPISTKVMVFGAANFAIDTSGWLGDVPITTWVYQENKLKGFHDFEDAPKILKFYQELIGKYPYAKLANVQSKTKYGGMENASNIFYFEDVVNGDKQRNSLIAHEMVHQWFGNTVTEADWAHAWISEGFATYLTKVYTERTNGEEEFRSSLAADREKVVQYYKMNPLPVVDTLLVTYPRVLNLGELLSTNTYQKGSWILHMLRNELGDEVFWQAVQQFYKDYKYSIATTEDFKKVVESISGGHLDTFFNQWYYTAGHPVLQGTWSYKNGELIVNLDQVQKEPFIFTVEIGLVYGSKMEFQYMKVLDTHETFQIVANKPDRVILDPNTKLLFEGNNRLQYYKE